MTYEEFEKEVEKLELTYHYNYCFVSIYYPTHNSYPLAYVSKETLNRVIITAVTSLLTPSKNSKLLTLCCKLAKTPINKRGELK